MPLTREQLADAIRKSTGGSIPSDSPINPILPPSDPSQLNIMPSRPNPEAAALAQIRQAAAKNAVNLPAASNGINPDTGMPYFSPQAAPSPQDQQQQDMNAFKLQYLKNRAQGQ